MGLILFEKLIYKDINYKTAGENSLYLFVV